MPGAEPSSSTSSTPASPPLAVAPRFAPVTVPSASPIARRSTRPSVPPSLATSYEQVALWGTVTGSGVQPSPVMAISPGWGTNATGRRVSERPAAERTMEPNTCVPTAASDPMTISSTCDSPVPSEKVDGSTEMVLSAPTVTAEV